MMNDNNRALFQEKQPRYVFMGHVAGRSALIKYQWANRVVGVICLITAIWIASIVVSSNTSDLHTCFSIILVLFASALLFDKSERKIQSKLDGNTRLLIYNDRISIPPRKRRKLIGKPDQLLKSNIEHIIIKRGGIRQHINKDDYVIWDWAPTEIIIKTKNGMKYKSGPKPPKTIIEAMNILRNSWGVPIDFPGNGMGTGTIYINGERGMEFSYEEIVKMNRFEWEE